MNINQLLEMKQQGEKIAMLTCYDYSSACIMNQSKVEMILVGDSAAMVMHGEDSTLPISVAMMEQHVRAVSRGAGDKFVVADMPFLSYRQSLDVAMQAVGDLMQAGANAVKLEGVLGNESLIEHIVQSGVPVMGHLGLTPQSINQLGGFKVQGRDEQAAEAIVEAAVKLQQAGCFAVVLECVPAAVAKRVRTATDLITIGIGAGGEVDGQVLVMQDLLGFPAAFSPKFVRRYLDTEKLFREAFDAYAEDVKSGDFPKDEESY